MADQRKEIKFNKSMTADKRNENFAYLAKQIADVSADGLYPARDYTEFTTMPTISSGVINGIWGIADVSDQTKPYNFLRWLHDKGSHTYDWYKFGSTTPESSPTAKTITGIVDAGNIIYYTDGTDIRKTSSLTSLASYSGSAGNTAGGYDGLYAWFVEEGGDIWRWLPSDTPGASPVEKIFTGSPFEGIVKIDFYKEQMVIFDNNSNSTNFDGNNYVYFWDKANTTFFSKRLDIKGYILAGGVINEELYVVYSLANTGNPKEEVGEIVVAQYNGEKFVEINRIKAGGRFVNRFINTGYEYMSGNACSINENFLIFSVSSNNNTKDEIYRNYIYKVSNGGYITVEAGPVNETSLGATPTFIKTLRTFNIYIYSNKIYTNEETDETNTEYTNYTKTTYITNFLCNPYNTHRLEALSLSFEKLFNVEELDIYYRTSDKESFVLLANVTRQKVIDYVNKRIDQTGVVPTPSQRYQITKMPDNSALPEFNEIQFKFVSKKGFSIIGSWFDYIYINRNTLK